MMARAVVASLVTALILGGCSSIEPLTEVRINATDRINPDAADRASPVVVRVYELVVRDTFESADFYELYDNPEELLGDKLVSVREIVLKPEQQWEKSLNLDGRTRYLGMLGAFRQIEKADWRILKRIDPDDGRPVDVVVDGIELQLTRK
ncbi:type VI secretion system protein VasD [Halospina denitrificans]|uniref:Type VI secretion system protein VasD n=1 Tax=Halospina denitrificans TaxID=332522 RepID=A0A4R7JZI8_9GAMM|nr:type VI secretion system lipoprotein TssJ [Halospina denitrificans]TDT43962.1 type VI secretion system protein VasD [Halospina denitrificans]